MAHSEDNRSVIACLDVDYRAPSGPAVAGCVLFRDWADPEPFAEVVAVTLEVAPYVPGQFYRRELPCLVAVLEKVKRELEIPVDVAVIDGYVWLANETDAGLGAHLHRALGEEIAVIGVAKNPFRSSQAACQLVRGESENPLHVTAIGLDRDDARDCIARMAGPFRLPTLVKRVDRLCRDHTLI